VAAYKLVMHPILFIYLVTRLFSVVLDRPSPIQLDQQYISATKLCLGAFFVLRPGCTGGVHGRTRHCVFHLEQYANDVTFGSCVCSRLPLWVLRVRINREFRDHPESGHQNSRKGADATVALPNTVLKYALFLSVKSDVTDNRRRDPIDINLSCVSLAILACIYSGIASYEAMGHVPAYKLPAGKFF
jgi:hypothetical protein